MTPTLATFPINTAPRKTEDAPPQDPNRLLRLKDVLKLVPVSPSTWWAWVAQGKAPAPIRFGNRCTCWRYLDILALTGKEAA